MDFALMEHLLHIEDLRKEDVFPYEDNDTFYIFPSTVVLQYFLGEVPVDSLTYAAISNYINNDEDFDKKTMIYESILYACPELARRSFHLLDEFEELDEEYLLNFEHANGDFVEYIINRSDQTYILENLRSFDFDIFLIALKYLARLGVTEAEIIEYVDEDMHHDICHPNVGLYYLRRLPIDKAKELFETYDFEDKEDVAKSIIEGR
jgi:hypothetical protein